MIRTLKHLLIYVLLTSLSFVGFTQTVQAALIGTDQVHAANAMQQSRTKIAAALDRPEVIAQLEKMGVSPAEAKDRVAALTDEEAASLASHAESLPAGGESILGVLVFIFVLLLVTDILGLTKVFPFTRSRR